MDAMEEVNYGRRLFLKRFSLNKKEELPLPRFLPLPYLCQVDYAAYCQKCEMKSCVQACEEKIIAVNDQGIAAIIFGQQGCTFCEKCAMECDSDELKVLFDLSYQKIEADIKLSIDACVAWNQTICYSCKDACDQRAITFSGLFYPQIQDHCTCCGFCIPVCPTQAIHIKPLSSKA